MLEVSKGTKFEGLVQSLMEYRQELQKEIKLAIEEHNKEMMIRIEEATWKFAKWTWLKRLLKYINSLTKRYFRKANIDYDKAK